MRPRSLGVVTRVAVPVVAISAFLAPPHAAASERQAPAEAHAEHDHSDHSHGGMGDGAPGLPPSDPERGMNYTGLRLPTGKGPCSGLLEIVGPRDEVLGCTHGPDPAPDGVDLSEQPSTADLGADAALTVPCDGNGTSGFRVQAMYVYPTGMASRFPTVESSIKNLAATNVDAIFDNSASKTGTDRDVRFVHNSSCEPVVLEVGITSRAFNTFGRTINALRGLGYNATDRKYLIWMDVPSGRSAPYCGIAEIFVDQNPTVGNFNNGHPGVPGMFARTDLPCWGLVSDTPVEAHELMHNLGGVQYGAPSTSYRSVDVSPGLHCTDEYDVMCYDDDGGGPLSTRVVCPTSAAVRLFDCDDNDYFNLAPPAGSYLATYWNTANNRFLVGAAAPALPPPPANDAFADAQIVSGQTAVATGTNLSATKESGEPNHAAQGGGSSVWYRWSAPASGTVSISTIGSSFDTLLGVYTGSAVGSLTTIASNDDASASTYQSAVSFSATAGVTYRIAVDGYYAGNSPGAVQLNINAVAHGCGVRTYGAVACWGSNASGQATPPSGSFRSVSAGGRHTCGVRTTGTLACWGGNVLGQASPPAGRFLSVDAGGNHNCGVRANGRALCWGSNAMNESSPPTGVFTQVDAGSTHTCGIRLYGRLACWGSNASGQATPPTGPFTAVSGGVDHTCGIRVTGKVACWGANLLGQSSPPTGTFMSVHAGLRHTCGVRTNGKPACWGSDAVDQLHLPTGTYVSVMGGRDHTCGVRTSGTLACWGADLFGESSPPTGRFRVPTLSAGNTHTCGVRKDGKAACWGTNGSGQSTPPTGTFVMVAAGTSHSCAIRTVGTVGCWGANGAGQSSPPTGTFAVVSGGGSHTCGIRTNGTAACWGANGAGQSTPPMGAFVEVAAGGDHTCGLRPNGNVACWGANGAGQATAPSGTYTSVTAGDSHSCATLGNGRVACWGANGSGQATPLPGAFVSIEAGANHTCGVRSTGTVGCWGLNGDGQSTPPAGAFLSVTGGGFHTCGVKVTGTTACWGRNTSGQSTPPPGI